MVEKINYTIVSTLFNKIAQYNCRHTFDDGSTLLFGTIRLLNNYPNAVETYVNDETGETSLLEQIAGSNALDQLQTHKDILNNYGIKIY